MAVNRQPWPSHRWLLAILILSVALRVAVALYLGDSVPPAKDELSYSTLAARLATGHGYTFPVGWYPFTPAGAPTSHWSFLYTAFVAGVYAFAGEHPLAVRLVQAVVTGLLMPLLTYCLAGRITASRPEADRPVYAAAPLVAAALSAVYAYFVLYGAMVQTEAFFICAVLWSLVQAMALEARLRSRNLSNDEFLRAGFWTTVLGFGLSLGIATLLRQSFLPWVAALFAYLLWVGIGGTRPGRLPRLARTAADLFVAALVLVVCIAPFTVRNHRVYGQVLLLNSNAGYAMYSAQHPLHGTDFQEYAAAPLPEDLVDQGLNEAQWDKALMRRGIDFVLAEPGRYLRLSLSRVRDYFEFWPTANSSSMFNMGRVLSIGLFLPFMLGGIVLAVRRFGSRLALLYLFIIVYSVLHVLTWAMSRYRLPVDAAALPFAAIAIHALASRIFRRLPYPARLLRLRSFLAVSRTDLPRWPYR